MGGGIGDIVGSIKKSLTLEIKEGLIIGLIPGLKEDFIKRLIFSLIDGLRKELTKGIRRNLNLSLTPGFIKSLIPEVIGRVKGHPLQRSSLLSCLGTKIFIPFNSRIKTLSPS